jgi:hypothetical protein
MVYKSHVVGAIQNIEYLQFYKPGDFDFSFQFEPGHRYRVSPGVVRVGKLALFLTGKRKFICRKYKS